MGGYLFQKGSFVTAAAAAALLAGCGGSQSLVGSAAPQSVEPALQSRLVPEVKDKCSAHGGVRVTPCSLNFTASSAGPQTVIVRIPKDKKGKLTESDDCGGTSGVAGVAADTGKAWTVTAGSSSGSCKADFDYTNARGKRVLGYASLTVSNSL